jgi:thiamine pyrophosphate-dependent acetolactate synthase large subunit-like protein
LTNRILTSGVLKNDPVLRSGTMADYPQGVDMAAAIAAGFTLDRREAVPALIGRHEDFLFVTGLAGTARDIAALTHDGAHIYTMAGAMGGAAMIGLGLALARPDKRVLVATGDGELLMNIGALATIAVLNPANLAILCVDNGHYGETGYQKSHTSLGVDLEKIAAGSGIKRSRTVASEADLAEGARLLREGNGAAFVVLKVKPDDPPAYKRNLDPASSRVRFRGALLGAG